MPETINTQIKIGVNKEHQIFIELPEPSRMLGLNVEQAVQLGQMLIFKAGEASALRSRGLTI